jgi:RimJ/RimL family protein N-acetyltransferase
MIYLETERLLFRDHEKADLEPFCEMETDPEYRWPQAPRTREAAEETFREVWLPRKELALRATVFKPEGRYIGLLGLYPRRDEENRLIAGEARLAYYLARPYWGRGLATEGSRAFVEHGFTKLGLARIEAGVNAQNGASIRVLEKLGFQWIESGEGGGNRWHRYELRNPAGNQAG